MVEKKNPDYAASAVMLTNPPQLGGLLGQLHAEQAALGVLETEAKACVPVLLTERIVKYEKDIAESMKAIKIAIDLYGSYQDVDKGEYAVKQKRESIIYKPELVRQYAPSKVASFVLVESVDAKALDAMVKAGQLTPLEARQCGEVKESFAYIVK